MRGVGADAARRQVETLGVERGSKASATPFVIIAPVSKSLILAYDALAYDAFHRDAC